MGVASGTFAGPDAGVIDVTPGGTATSCSARASAALADRNVAAAPVSFFTRSRAVNVSVPARPAAKYAPCAVERETTGSVSVETSAPGNGSVRHARDQAGGEPDGAVEARTKR